MKLKDAVKFVCHNDGTSEEMFPYEKTREILKKYGNKNVLKVNVNVQIEGEHELSDDIVYEFYLDI